MAQRKYNLVPSPVDERDQKYKPPFRLFAKALPPSVDLRPLCSAIVDQGQLGCHDDKTEVLTKTGWKFFSQLIHGEELATINPETQELKYEKPTQLFKYDYKGDMISINHEFLDFKVTPNHKMVVRKWNEKDRTLENKYSFVEAQDLGWYVGVLNRINYVGSDSSEYFTCFGIDHKQKPQREDTKIEMKIWLRFLGIYLAEGTMLKEDQRKGRVSYKIQIAGSKEREKIFIREVLKNIGIVGLELNDRFTFQNKRIYKALESLGLKGKKSPEKFVPSFVFNQSSENIKEFLLGFFVGDGSEQNGLKSLYTSSAQLSEELQRLAFLAGVESHISIREARSCMLADGRTIVGNYPEYRVSLCERKNLSIDNKNQIFKEYYEGEVFCAEVPSYHTLVTRRNKKILVSGNSCTANALVSGVREFLLKKSATQPFVNLSRLYLYYEERAAEGTAGDDSGAYLKDGCDILLHTGVCTEKSWPYIESKFKIVPPPANDTEAAQYKVNNYAKLSTVMEMKTALANGNILATGIAVYPQMESTVAQTTGIVSIPSQGEQPLGGHAVCTVGYVDTPRGSHYWKGGGYFWMRNSWSSNWGLNGYFKIAYDYVNLGYAYESWVLS